MKPLSKGQIYAGIAGSNAILAHHLPPASWWEWVLMFASVTVAILTALKALASTPDALSK